MFNWMVMFPRLASCILTNRMDRVAHLQHGELLTLTESTIVLATLTEQVFVSTLHESRDLACVCVIDQIYSINGKTLLREAFQKVASCGPGRIMVKVVGNLQSIQGLNKLLGQYSQIQILGTSVLHPLGAEIVYYFPSGRLRVASGNRTKTEQSWPHLVQQTKN